MFESIMKDYFKGNKQATVNISSSLGPNSDKYVRFVSIIWKGLIRQNSGHFICIIVNYLN